LLKVVAEHVLEPYARYIMKKVPECTLFESSDPFGLSVLELNVFDKGW